MPRSIEKIFGQLRLGTQLEMKISYIEIYNEKIIDLLNPQKEEKKQSITQVSAVKVEDVFDAYMKGSYVRKTIGTNLNNFSSRSHSIFSIYYKAREDQEFTYFHFLDLAGSERIFKYETNKEIINQSKNINLSLLNLQKVFLAMEKQGSGSTQFVPFRNSALTMFLKESLSQNTQITIFLTLNMHKSHISETIQSLRFGLRCKNIKIDF